MSPIWLLVTTSRSLLLLDGRSGRGYRLDAGRGLYYGLAARGDLTYVGARRRLASSGVPAVEERGQILVLDADLVCRAVLEAPFPLRDIHQILFHDGRLWVTCPFDDMVAIYDGTAWERWYPLGMPRGEARDVNHFNTLAVLEGLLCVLAHNKGPSDLLLFSLPERTLVESIRLGEQAHNVWRRGGEWVTCSSFEGRIVGTGGFCVETGGFPRGVGFAATETFVGVSEVAERRERDFTSGQILAYDPAWRCLRQIRLVGEGLVLEILPLADGRGAPGPATARAPVAYPVTPGPSVPSL